MNEQRLCIDVRAASEFAARGMLAQEVAEEIVAMESEPGATGNYPMFLSHPDQPFSGGPRRIDTKMRMRRTPVHWYWEWEFLRNENVRAFHRFRPADRLAPYPNCPSVTTLLPTRGRLPFFLSHRPRHIYVVPSERERSFLEKSYGVPAEQCAVIRPGVRRYVHLMPGPTPAPEGYVLFLVGKGENRTAVRKWIRVIAERFPELRRRVIRLKNHSDFSPGATVKLLAHAKVCIYLTSAKFDWPTLALESIFHRVPTLFADDHASLGELLPHSPLRVSPFLVDAPDLATIARETVHAKETLEAAGVFAPFAQAAAYRALYAKL